MTTRDVHDRHMRQELDGDLDTRLSDYPPDAIVATPDGIGLGHDYIRPSYERLLPLITSTELTSSLIATDTFVIHDDLIHMHTFYANATSPTIDEQS